MPMPQINWDDVQQLPDDGNRYEAIEGALYSERLGEIELAGVFAEV